MDLRQKVCDGAANSSGTRKMMFYLVSYFTTWMYIQDMAYDHLTNKLPLSSTGFILINVKHDDIHFVSK